MQIVVTGPRGGGSSTLAIEIAKLCERKGMKVRFRSHDHKAEQELRRAMRHESPDAWRMSSVTIIDGCEREDEEDVRRSGEVLVKRS